MNKKFLLGLGAFVLVLGGLLIITSKSSASQANGMAENLATPKLEDNQQPIQPADKLPSVNISVEGNEFAFTPKNIMLKKGQAVQLTFKNTGSYPHNLVISDLDVKTKIIKPGQTDTINFTALKIGKFQYICSIGTHADKGMVGELTVN
jgi:plastocyanin